MSDKPPTAPADERGPRSGSTATEPDRRSGSPEIFHAFWSGPSLSGYEALCLRSLAASGQKILLFSYDMTLPVPEGVELVDAREVLPGDRAHEFVYATGERSPALFSDLFRYEVVRRFGGWYVDLDVVMLRDAPPSAEIYLARQDQHLLNAAVMRFPRDAPLLAAAATEARSRLGDPEWGAIGPTLITRLVEEHGLGHLVRPSDSAFPVAPHQVHQLFLPEFRDALDRQAEASDFVHLWHEIWRRVRIPKEYGPPEGSYLDGLFRRFAVPVRPAGRLPADAVRHWFREFEAWNQAKHHYGATAATPDFVATLCQAAIERDQLLGSTSWRVTAPLRTLTQAYRRVAAAAGKRPSNV
jgi:hypothetical protein